MLWVVLAFVGIMAGLLLARYRHSRSSVLSLIVLFREPTILSTERIATSAKEVGLSFEQGSDPIEFTLDGYQFRLLTAPFRYGEGYLDHEDLVEKIPEARLREAVRDHQAFVSFWFNDSRRGDWPAVIDKLGRLIADLVDEQALVVWRADTNQAVRLTDEVRSRMGMGETSTALAELVGDEITMVSEEDPKMLAAVQEAQSRWPEFVEAVQRIQDPDATWAKAPFTDGLHTEHMWVQVAWADGTKARGRLMNKPFQVKGYREGQEVELKAEDISDWMYGEGEEMVGLFTEKIVRGIE